MDAGMAFGSERDILGRNRSSKSLRFEILKAWGQVAL